MTDYLVAYCQHDIMVAHRLYEYWMRVEEESYEFHGQGD